MKVCDGCKDDKCFLVKTNVIKEELHARRAGKRGADKQIIQIEMDLCDKCLSKFTIALGYFVLNFRKGKIDASESEKKGEKESPTLEESTVKKAE